MTADTLEIPDTDRQLAEHSFVGWGCKTFDQTSDFKRRSFPQ
jgi:hypothetical protein